MYYFHLPFRPLNFRMSRWRGKVALVTGASSGIGAAICRELVGYEMNVVGCARDLPKLQALAQEPEIARRPAGALHTIKCDLTKESEISAMFNEIREKFGGLDVCINNAGFSTNSPLLEARTEDLRSMLEVNILALCICTREAVRLMSEKNVKEGQIIQIGSIAGHRLPNDNSIPAFNFYTGTKFMVRALTEGLRQEIKALNTNIRVSNISPALVKTEFLSRSLDPDTADYIFSKVKSLEPKDVADAVSYILQCPEHLDISDMILESVEKKPKS